MMQPIPDEYVAPESDRAVWNDGEYRFKGIRWFTLDERQNPILKAQKDGRMVGRFHAILEDDSEGPPMSLELSQMALLTQVFGVPLTALPKELPTFDKPGKIAEYMTKIEQLIEASGKTATGTVARGWINSVDGMDVTGFIYFVLDDIPATKGMDEPAPRTSAQESWGSYFLVSFQVLAGEGGSPSPFAKAHFTELLTYAIDTKVAEDGTIVCDWKRNSNGEFSLSAVTQSKLMKWTAPSMFSDGYVMNNPENILPEWLREAKKKMQVLKGYRARSAKGDRVVLQWATVEPVYDFHKPEVPHEEAVSFSKSSQPVKQVMAPVPASVHNTNGRDDMAAKLILKELICALTEGDAFDGDTFELTDAGKNVARTYLTPLKKQGYLPTGVLKDLIFEDVVRVFDNIKVPDDKKEISIALKRKLAEAGLIGEGSDRSDF